MQHLLCFMVVAATLALNTAFLYKQPIENAQAAETKPNKLPPCFWIFKRRRQGTTMAPTPMTTPAFVTTVAAVDSVTVSETPTETGTNTDVSSETPPPDGDGDAQSVSEATTEAEN